MIVVSLNFVKHYEYELAFTMPIPRLALLTAITVLTHINGLPQIINSV